MVQRKENVCEDLIEYLYYKEFEIIVFLVSSKRSNSTRKDIIERNLQLIFTRIIQIFFRFFISPINYSFLGDNTIEYCTKERGFEYLYYKNLYYYLSKCVGTINSFAKFVSSKPSSIYKHQISNARIVFLIPSTFKLNFYRDKRNVSSDHADSRWMISPGLDRSNRPSLRYF